MQKRQGPDLIATIMRTPERERIFSFSKDYIRSPWVIFSRSDAELFLGIDDLAGKALAVSRGTVVQERLESDYPEIRLLPLDTDEAALKAVSSGAADAYIGNLTLASYLILQNGFTNLKVAAPSPLGDHVFAMGSRKDWPELGNLINKALDTISQGEQAAIRNKWVSVRLEQGLRFADILKTVLVAAGGAACLLLFFVHWNRRLAKEVKERRHAEEKLERARNELELRVQERTAALQNSNTALEAEIAERELAEEKIQAYQQRLKALVAQLSLAEERERRRIAAELHDRVGQSLALARMQLAVVCKSTSAAKPAAILAEISGTLREAIQDTRQLVFDLSSPLMNEVGLSAALAEWLEEQIEKRHGLETRLIDRGPEVHPDEDVRAMLFRNVRELLANVVKHARASRVTVHLEHLPNCLKIAVEDDGVGFDCHLASLGARPKSGFGLLSIQERMADLGGALEMASEPGSGCTATLTLPLPNQVQ
jgi:signal transduction histidine kinase